MEKQILTDDVQEHLLSTFFSLRKVTGWIGVLFPIVLGLGGLAGYGGKLRPSLSDYYCDATAYTGMRQYFVGGLFAIGVCLYLYKGFSVRENMTLNIAGALAVGIAVFPMQGCGGPEWFGLQPHFVSAILFFLCIAVVMWFFANDTLHLLHNEHTETIYKVGYRTLAVLMMLCVVLATVLQYVRPNRVYTYGLEVIGIWFFAAYWFIKSKELSISCAEKRVMDRDTKPAGAGTMQPAA